MNEDLSEPLRSFKMRRSIPTTLITFINSLTLISKRNIRKIDSIKLNFERKEYLKNRMMKSSNVNTTNINIKDNIIKTLQNNSDENNVASISNSINANTEVKIADIEKDCDERIVDCINHMNFILNRVEARVDLIKELTLIHQILEK